MPLFGAWDALIALAREIHRVFERFTQENLREFPGPEGKTLTMALAIAPDDETSLAEMYESAGERLAIAKETSPGVTWGEDTWHKIRVERTLADGMIKVYFDDMTKPIQWAQDKTFGVGYIGFGSFDDLGKIDNIKIYGPLVEPRKTGFFEAKGE